MIKFMSTINRRKKMDQEGIIQSLFNMLQKSNSEKINMQLTIDKLTAENEALKTESKKEKTEKVKTESSEK